VETDK